MTAILETLFPQSFIDIKGKRRALVTIPGKLTFQKTREAANINVVIWGERYDGNTKNTTFEAVIKGERYWK